MSPNCGAGEDSKSLDSETRPVNLQRDQPWLLTGRTDELKLVPVFAHLVRIEMTLGKSAWCWEWFRQKQKQVLEGEMAGMASLMQWAWIGQNSEMQEIGRSACYSSWGCKAVEWLSSWNNNNNGKSNMLGLGDLQIVLQGEAYGIMPLCCSSSLGVPNKISSYSPFESSLLLISRFILSLGKEEKETDLCLLVQTVKLTVQLSISQNCFSFLERVHCVWGIGRRHFKKSKLNME